MIDLLVGLTVKRLYKRDIFNQIMFIDLKEKIAESQFIEFCFRFEKNQIYIHRIFKVQL